MTNGAYESKLRSGVRSSMHSCPGSWVAIRLPRHLMQELNVVTVVCTKYLSPVCTLCIEKYMY